jgi:hypothetical protein
MNNDDEADPLAPLWFVLLIQDGNDVTTENPRAETFYSERDAIKFARDSARDDEEGGEGAHYHVMKTTHIVSAKRRVTVNIVKPRRS